MIKFGGFGISTLTTNQTTTLRDVRDNSTYTVAKLLDGKCWMTQNLSIQDYNANSRDTDIESDFYIIKGNLNSFKEGYNTIDQTKLNGVVIKAGYGGFYTWFSATAGSDIAINNATQSICPKKWRLPNGNELTEIHNKYGNNGLYLAPVNMVVGGDPIEGIWRENTAYYLSSTTYASGYQEVSLSLGGNSGSITSSSISNGSSCCNARHGFQIRCIYSEW